MGVKLKASFKTFSPEKVDNKTAQGEDGKHRDDPGHEAASQAVLIARVTQ